MDLAQQFALAKRGAVEIIPEDELKNKLARSQKTRIPLRIKMGFDPTSPDIHLGHTVGLRKLRQFQEMGHVIVVIVGDYTGMVGDPSGRSVTRPRLTEEQVRKNAETYLAQFFRVVDRDRCELRHNGEWFSVMSFSQVMELGSRYTVARLLERDDFTKRFRAGEPISIHELFYPLMQGWDSVMVDADVELGGTDQKFNLLVGRELMRDVGKEPQICLTLPMLEGLDGAQKMSKSLGNYIGITDTPADIFGKTMSLPDSLILRYFTLVTDVSSEEIAAMDAQLKGGANPMTFKKQLGETLARMYWDAEAGAKARSEFEAVFSSREAIPEDTPTIDLPAGGMGIIPLIMEHALCNTTSDARRMLQQGAVSLDGEKVTQVDSVIMPGEDEKVLKVGKRRFLRIRRQA